MEQDPRLSSIEPAFARLIAQSSSLMSSIGAKKTAMPKHFVLGELTLSPDAAIPPHSSLPPRATFPAILYHSGSKDRDEAAWDTRRAVLRLFTPESRSQCAWADPVSPAGRCEKGREPAPGAGNTSVRQRARPARKVFATCQELHRALRDMEPTWDLVLATGTAGFPFGSSAEVNAPALKPLANIQLVNLPL